MFSVRMAVGCILLALLSLVSCLQNKSGESKKVARTKTFIQTEGIHKESPPCRFENLTVPRNAAVFAAGGYSGQRLKIQIDQSGHFATRMNVVVNHEKKPVILILGAYEPTIWNISRTKETQLTAVLIMGYHRQVAVGLEKNLPLLISTHDNQGACGEFHVAENQLQYLNPISQTLFHRNVDMVFLSENGKITVGDALPKDAETVRSGDITLESFCEKESVLSGLPALDAAVEQGLLKKATQDDVRDWVDAVAKSGIRKNLPPVSGKTRALIPRPHLHHAYVVLKPFTYPSGLFGANAATFFIPKGTAKPHGHPGHSTVYDFNTLSCQGSFCR